MTEIEKFKSFPHVLLYWGDKGGGLRLLSETIQEIVNAGYSTVKVSVKSKTYKFLISQINLPKGQKTKIINTFSPSVFERIFLFLNLPFSKKKLSKKLKQAESIVVVMSSPGDLQIDSLRTYGVKVTRVIHDINKHPGDLWPTNKTIKKMISSQRIITLSNFVFKNIQHPDKFESSLARRNVVAEIDLNLFDSSESYFVSIGRFKKYKNLDMLREIAVASPGKNFIFAGVGSSAFRKVPNIKVIDRWLSDAELEALIKNSTALLALYLEASQSGIVEQALYWRIPCIVSNRGALYEQVKQQNLTKFFPENPDAKSIAILLNSNFDEWKNSIPTYRVKETFYQTLLRLDV